MAEPSRRRGSLRVRFSLVAFMRHPSEHRTEYFSSTNEIPHSVSRENTRNSALRGVQQAEGPYCIATYCNAAVAFFTAAVMRSTAFAFISLPLPAKTISGKLVKTRSIV